MRARFEMAQTLRVLADVAHAEGVGADPLSVSRQIRAAIGAEHDEPFARDVPDAQVDRTERTQQKLGPDRRHEHGGARDEKVGEQGAESHASPVFRQGTRNA